MTYNCEWMKICCGDFEVSSLICVKESLYLFTSGKMSTDRVKIVGYARVSTKSQDTSLDNQQR